MRSRGLAAAASGASDIVDAEEDDRDEDAEAEDGSIVMWNFLERGHRNAYTRTRACTSAPPKLACVRVYAYVLGRTVASHESSEQCKGESEGGGERERESGAEGCEKDEETPLRDPLAISCWHRKPRAQEELEGGQHRRRACQHRC